MKKLVIRILTALIIGFFVYVTLVTLSMEKSHAASSTRSSYSSKPKSSSYYKSSYRKTTTKKPTLTKKLSKALERDDDVECSTLQFSRHAADREVYKRYC